MVSAVTLSHPHEAYLQPDLAQGSLLLGQVLFLYTKDDVYHMSNLQCPQ